MSTTLTCKTTCGLVVARTGRQYRLACPTCRKVPRGRACGECGVTLPHAYSARPVTEDGLPELIKAGSAAMGAVCRRPERCASEVANLLYLMGRLRGA